MQSYTFLLILEVSRGVSSVGNADRAVLAGHVEGQGPSVIVELKATICVLICAGLE